MLGDRSLSGEQIEVMQETLNATGALDKIETMISDYVSQAMEALHGAGLSPGATAELTRLAEAVTQRQA
jgi:geranylgeranyl diphosphate synthase type I